MVIADSSVWITFLREPASTIGTELAGLVRSSDVAITGVILAEVLQGARSDREFNRLREDLEAIPCFDASIEVWVRAADLRRRMRALGQTVAMTDLSIAAIAQIEDAEIFTSDTDFARIPGIRLYQEGIS